MSDLKEVGVGFKPDDLKKMQSFLQKFLKHVKPGKLAICGGIATRLHLAQNGTAFPPRPFNDFDFLIEHSEDILPSVTKEFMIYHYHPPGVDDPVEKDYFFYAFVEASTRTKADVFPYRWSSPHRFVKGTFMGHSVNVVGIEDQIIQCLYDVSRISPDMKVDPKQLRDVHTLIEIADMAILESIWKKNAHPLYPKTFGEALKRADKIKATHPELWKKKPYVKSGPYKCSHCVSRPEFPIADMKEIVTILGEVE